MQNRIWFITGISGGLGKALAEAVMAHGDFAVGTFRSEQQAADFSKQNEGKGLGLVIDVTQQEQVRAALEVVRTNFGRLDVLVNNAGFGFAGAVEEASNEEVRAVMEANFFGALEVTRQALPLFRQQKRGHILQISSHGGIKAFPGFGIYNAAKFALEGFSEALAGEVAPLGIHLSIIEPGPFRTGFAAGSFQEASAKIDDYQATAGAFRERMRAVNGKQEGDPEKAAAAIYHITTLENPPLRLPLGKIPLTTIQAKLDSVQKDLNDGRELAEGTVF
ncbi:MAG: oxidoreductase [Haliscomenobacter sp.]|uniref:oxidoreductase n=1 Tax=Haliscomenobacter sp. TaxID=2717303 RepID=UPI0029A748A0|nr:oxidoreductase [Haliscomenobacter sp.]MDX2069467.1 oxidoreductase [Haliscomenobacter sp.]